MRSPKAGRTVRLAFIIPAYKGKFLAATLTSLAEQTNRNFSVYIGDDTSPDELLEVIEPFRDRLNLHYQHFSDNLGQDSLVKQWERCVDLSNEEFFCLLADDDVIDSNCVAGFYAELEKSNELYDVYNFGQAIIDGHGQLISYIANPPQTETDVDFLYNRLRLNRTSFISAYIIRREAYLREKGFVEFPLAWFSDDASIIRFANLTGIRGIPGTLAYWRLSGQNISSADEETYWIKITATLGYLQWLSATAMMEKLNHYCNNRTEHRTLVEHWFFYNLACYGGYPLNLHKLTKVSSAIHPYCKSSRIALFFKLHALSGKNVLKGHWEINGK